MSILLGQLPETVTINGAEVPINTDFRVGIQFEELLTSDLTPEQVTVEALRLYYPKIPDSGDQAIERLLWFYQGSKELPKSYQGSKEQVYSYEHDYDYILAAFMEQYKVDLSEARNLHWWKFRAMFVSLSENTMLEKIMLYRSIDTRGMELEQRRAYDKMKKLYQLPKRVSEERQQRDDAIIKALLNGGDVAAVLGSK